MAKPDQLQKKIEASLRELLDGKSTKSAEEKTELRQNVLLAIKWQSVKLKMEDEKWGSGFSNGNAKREDEDLDDERSDDGLS